MADLNTQQTKSINRDLELDATTPTEACRVSLAIRNSQPEKVCLDEAENGESPPLSPSTVKSTHFTQGPIYYRSNRRNSKSSELNQKTANTIYYNRLAIKRDPNDHGNKIKVAVNSRKNSLSTPGLSKTQ